MEPAALSRIIDQMNARCWKCGGFALRSIYEPIIGAIVLCDECGHEHYFESPIPNVPDFD